MAITGMIQDAPARPFKVWRNYEDEELFDDLSYSSLIHPNERRIAMKLSSGGGALCEGQITLFKTNGEVLTLKPALGSTNVLSGFGEWRVFETDQWTP